MVKRNTETKNGKNAHVVGNSLNPHYAHPPPYFAISTSFQVRHKHSPHTQQNRKSKERCFCCREVRFFSIVTHVCLVLHTNHPRTSARSQPNTVLAAPIRFHFELFSFCFAPARPVSPCTRALAFPHKRTRTNTPQI